MAIQARATVDAYGNFHTLGLVLRPPGPLTADAVSGIRLYEVTPGGNRRLLDPVRVSTFDYFAVSVFDLQPATTYNFRAEYYNLARQLAATETFTGTTRPEPGGTPNPVAQIHVAVTGNDAYPGTVLQPKRTIGAAFAAVTVPGTHVVIHTGTYYEGDLTPPNAGTASAPIVVRAATNEVVILDGSAQNMLQTGWTDRSGGYYSRSFSGDTWLVAFRNRVTGQTFRCYPVSSLSQVLNKYVGSTANTFAKYNITGAYYCSGSAMRLYAPAFVPGGNVDMCVSIRDKAIEHGQDDYIIYDGLTFRFFQGMGIYVNDSNDIIIRNCRFEYVNVPIGVKRNSNRLLVEGCTFIDDCTRWGFLPKGGDGYGYSGYIETGAVNVYGPYDGRGLVFRRNTIDGLFDGLHLCPSPIAPAVDTSETDCYENTIVKALDDLMELDGFSLNVRVFRNYMSNYLSGISIAQAVYGPTYVLYNDLRRHGQSTAVSIDGFQGFPIKSNGGTDYGDTGHVFFFHNSIWTDVAATPAFRVQYANWQKLTMANNIWLGTVDGWFNWQTTCSPVTMAKDIIYAPSGHFLTVSYHTYYDTPADCIEADPSFYFLTNAIAANPRFSDPANGIMTIASNSPAVNAGVIIPGVNDLSFTGSAPDIGAHELGGGVAVAFSVSSATVAESATGTVVQVKLSQAVAQTVTVNYRVTGGSAGDGDDFILNPGLVSFPPGQTLRTFPIRLLPDEEPEGSETAVIQLATPTNAVLGAQSLFTLQIVDDDVPPPVVAFSQAASSAQESPGTLSIPVTLSQAYGLAVTVHVEAVSGTASNGVDYDLPPGDLTFAPGQTELLVVISLIDDSETELDETIGLQLSLPLNATLGTNSAHTVTLVDNDQVRVTFDQASASIAESGGSLPVGISLSAAAPFPVAVDVGVDGGNAVNDTDYVFQAGACLFPPGQTHTNLSILITDDAQTEGNETFQLRLSNAVHAVISPLAVFAGTIRDDDAAVAYVDHDAVGANTGTSWANAFTDLADAMDTVLPLTQLWVAEGTYTPGNTPDAAFVLRENIALHGGFSGIESQLVQRAIGAHPTILSGDLAQNDTANWGSRADNARHVLIGETNNLTLSGLIIRGGNASTGSVFLAENQGGGLWANLVTGLTMSHCVFTDNAAAAGGGMYLRRCAGVVIEDCDFSGNMATEVGADRGSGAIGGEAFVVGQDARISRCRFTGNTAPGGRGGAFYATTTGWEVNFINCLFAGNTAGDVGGGVFLRVYDSQLINCTFSGNTPSAVYVRDASPVAVNSILWGDADEVAIYSGNFSATYTDIDDAALASSSQNLRADPLWRGAPSGTLAAPATYNPRTGLTTLTIAGGGWLPNEHAGRTVNPSTLQQRQFLVHANTTNALTVWGDASALGTNGAHFSLHDYRLSDASPCLDAANAASAPPGDIEGSARPQGLGVDMGAYELGSFRSDFSASPRSGFGPLATTFTAVTYGGSSTGLHYWWDFDSDGSTDLAGTNLNVVTNTYLLPGSYAVTLAVSNALGEVSTITRDAYVQLSPPVIYVSLQGAHQWPYASWSTAATNIADALSVAVDGALVLVSNGVYALENQLILNRAITLKGAFGPNETVLSGRHAVRCLYLANAGAVVDGLTLSEGWGDRGGGAYLDGGGLLTNCVVRHNEVSNEGGGVYVFQAGTVRDSTVASNNCVFTGGGLYLYQGGLAEHVSIEGNTANFGGGISIYLDGEVTSCTIAGNVSVSPDANRESADGGGIYAIGGGRVRDSLILGNRSGDDGGGAYATATSRFERCVFAFNIAGDDAGGFQGGETGGTPGGTLHECLLTSNQASDKGGGMYLWSAALAVNCVVISNTANLGAGVYSRDGGSLQNCTVSLNSAGNNGGGLMSNNGGLTRNTIVNLNYSPLELDVAAIGSPHLYDYVCSSGPLPGNGNTTNDPAFADVTSGNLRLTAGSSCIDTGSDEHAPAIDFDGTPRPKNGDLNGSAQFDIGAFEFIQPETDQDGDGLPDVWEIAHGLDPSRSTSSDGADGDPDGDGASNLAEYTADTDPTNVLSVLELTGITPATNNVQIWWKGGTGSVQSVEWATSLSADTGSWQVLYTHAPPTPASNSLVHPGGTNRAAFYRIKAVRP